MFSHHSILEILATTMLIYDYGKKFTLSEDEDIETFTNKLDPLMLQNMSSERIDILRKIRTYSPKGKVMMFIDDPITDLQVGITKSDAKKRLIVVFRGTESRSDWMYDFRICKRNLIEFGHGISVHSGFYKQLYDNDNCEKIISKLEEILSDAEYKDYEIYCTGHSLGGALCTLFGYILSHRIKNKVRVISFASPRVGNYQFKTYFEAKENLYHYRITNNRDIVTATPMIGYHHVGQNIHLSPLNCEFCEKYNRYWKFSLLRCWSILDHSIDLYYHRLVQHKWYSPEDPHAGMTEDEVILEVEKFTEDLINNVIELQDEYDASGEIVNI